MYIRNPNPELYFVAIIYEGIIIIIGSWFLLLIAIKYVKNRNYLILLLFLIILNLIIAIFFSWLSKVHILYSGIDYLQDDSVPDPLTPSSWILLRISEFRISLLFITIAIAISYVFKVKVFERGFKRPQEIIVIIYSCFTAFFSFFIYQKGNLLLDVLTFFFVFILMLIVYLPFMIRSFRSYKNTRSNIYRKAFLSLGIMSICAILTLFCFLINLIYVFYGHPGFTLFYFLAWIFVLIGIFGVYFGYIYPNFEGD